MHKAQTNMSIARRLQLFRQYFLHNKTHFDVADYFLYSPHIQVLLLWLLLLFLFVVFLVWVNKYRSFSFFEFSMCVFFSQFILYIFIEQHCTKLHLYALTVSVSVDVMSLYLPVWATEWKYIEINTHYEKGKSKATLNKTWDISPRCVIIRLLFVRTFVRSFSYQSFFFYPFFFIQCNSIFNVY